MVSDHTIHFHYTDDYTPDGDPQKTMMVIIESIHAGEDRELDLSLPMVWGTITPKEKITSGKERT